jgi:regulator of sigma E protease
MLSTIALKLLYFIIALGVLVFVHELGHFLVAKRAGIRVERFSLGYPPKMVGFRWGETEYCISWIPFGGYVKVAGMADVGADQSTGAPWEFPSKAVWVRMAVIAAGPAMNFAFAFVALVFLFRAYGIDTFESTAAAPEENSVAASAGLTQGDRILSVDGRSVSDAYQLLETLDQTYGRGAALQVQRTSGEVVPLSLPAAPHAEYGLRLLRPTTVGRVVPGTPAHRLGLRDGDRIMEVAGQPVSTWSEMSAEIRRHPGESVALVWERDGQRLSADVVPEARIEGSETIGQIGIGPRVVRHDVSLVESLRMGTAGLYTSSYLILDFLRELVRGERSAEELGGPLRIAQLAEETAEQGFNHFVSFMAMLSVNLAIINLLPIPVLDGGHLMFLALEGLRRRPLSLRQREVFQQIGLAIMLFIMVLVTFNDLNQMVFHRIAEIFQ